MDLVHGPGPWGGPCGPWTGSMGWSMDRVDGVVHGPGPWGGPWTPVHVLYTSWTASPFCWSLGGNLISPKPAFAINSNSQHWLLLTETTVYNKRYGNRILTLSIRFNLSFPRHARRYRVHWQRLSEKNGFCYIWSRCTQCKPWPAILHPGHF